MISSQRLFNRGKLYGAAEDGMDHRKTPNDLNILSLN